MLKMVVMMILMEKKTSRCFGKTILVFSREIISSLTKVAQILVVFQKRRFSDDDVMVLL